MGREREGGPLEAPRAGTPFFAVFNYFVTHESSLHKREPLVTDPAKVRVPAYLPDTPETRADIAQYHDRMARLDGQIAEALAELDEAGVADNTIVFYYGDNGGVLPRSKRFLYDNGTHVPLIIRFPKKWRHLAPSAPGSVNDEVVSLVDLPPTLMSLAGLRIPDQFEGRALAGPEREPGPPYVYAFRGRMDERYDMGRVVIGPRFRYIRNYRPDLPAGQHVDYLWRMASMRGWDELHRAGKLNAVQDAFFQPRLPEELYDVDADPDNIKNLAADPAYADVLRKMRAANRAHLLDTRDLGFMPEPMVRRLSRDRSPVWIGEDEKLYPLDELVDLVDRLQLPSHPANADLVAALTDSRTVVRYWGAIAARTHRAALRRRAVRADRRGRRPAQTRRQSGRMACARGRPATGPLARGAAHCAQCDFHASGLPRLATSGAAGVSGGDRLPVYAICPPRRRPASGGIRAAAREIATAPDTNIGAHLQNVP